MNDLCDDLRDHVDDILEDFEAVAQSEPWLTLPKGYGMDHLPAVANGLFEAAICTPRCQEAQRRLVWASAGHGEDRRTQNFGQENVLLEHQLLRVAIARYLRRIAGPERSAQTLIQVDAAISIATRASLFGYHRAELENVRRWPEVLEQLVTDSPLPAAAEEKA